MLQPVQEFLAESTVEEPCLIEPGILPFQGKMIVYGAPGIGKSLLVSQLGFDVATGQKWLGELPVKQGVVAYVQCEIGRGKFRDRMRKQVEAYEMPPMSFFVLTSLTVTFTDNNEEFSKLYRELLEIRPALLILDPQYKLFVGDENSNTEMKRFYNVLDMICGTVGCAIVLVSHNRKARFEEGVTIDRGFEELKGAARQQEWADSILRVVSAGTGKVIRFEKTRHEDEISALPITFDKETLLFSANKKQNVEAEILARLEGGPQARFTLVEILKRVYSESSVKRGLARLEEIGAVKMLPMPGNTTMKVVQRT